MIIVWTIYVFQEIEKLVGLGAVKSKFVFFRKNDPHGISYVSEKNVLERVFDPNAQVSKNNILKKWKTVNKNENIQER